MSVNAIKLFQDNARIHPDKMAIADIKFGTLSFSDIERISAKAQALARKYKLNSSDTVLLAMTPSPLLYGLICGFMGLGIRIIFIEPWLSLDRIDHVVRSIRPKMFISGLLGKVWGVRSAEIRNIPYWASPGEVMSMPEGENFQVTELSPEHHAFVVFSSGTSGAPKGVVRTHQYMQNIYDVFTTLEPQNFKGPDLIIFPNVALFHLATGRGSVIVPHSWSEKKLKATLDLCHKFRPDTLSTGPSFLKALMDQNLLKEFSFLERIVIGGALTDCWLLEDLFKAFPDARFLHLYGGSEAEPVTMIDAKKAVLLSREKDYFQTLCLGEEIPQIQTKIKDDDILWVSGANVAGEYIGEKKQNQGIKEIDSNGILWHCMGDRVFRENDLLWFAGRAQQRTEDFYLEQSIYSFLQSSKSFLHRRSTGELILVGEGVENFKASLLKKYPQIKKIKNTTIIRDKRHRSRINREASLPRSLRIRP